MPDRVPVEHWWCPACGTFDGPHHEGFCDVCADGTGIDGLVPRAELVRLREDRDRLVRLREDRDRLLEQSDERWQKLDAALTARDEARTWRVEFERLANQRAAKIERLREECDMFFAQAKEYEAEVERLNDLLDAFTGRNTRLAAEVERLREALSTAGEQLRRGATISAAATIDAALGEKIPRNNFVVAPATTEVERLEELVADRDATILANARRAEAEVERLRAYVRWCHNRQGEAPLTLEEIKAIVDAPPSDITAEDRP